MDGPLRPEMKRQLSEDGRALFDACLDTSASRTLSFAALSKESTRGSAVADPRRVFDPAGPASTAQAAANAMPVADSAAARTALKVISRQLRTACELGSLPVAIACLVVDTLTADWAAKYVDAGADRAGELSAFVTLVKDGFDAAAAEAAELHRDDNSSALLTDEQAEAEDPEAEDADSDDISEDFFAAEELASSAALRKARDAVSAHVGRETFGPALCHGAEQILALWELALHTAAASGFDIDSMPLAVGASLRFAEQRFDHSDTALNVVAAEAKSLSIMFPNRLRLRPAVGAAAGGIKFAIAIEESSSGADSKSSTADSREDGAGGGTKSSSARGAGKVRSLALKSRSNKSQAKGTGGAAGTRARVAGISFEALVTLRSGFTQQVLEQAALSNTTAKRFDSATTVALQHCRVPARATVAESVALRSLLANLVAAYVLVAALAPRSDVDSDELQPQRFFLGLVQRLLTASSRFVHELHSAWEFRYRAAGQCVRLSLQHNLFEPQHDRDATRIRLSMGELDASARASFFSEFRQDTWARANVKVQRVESVLAMKPFQAFRKSLRTMRESYESCNFDTIPLQERSQVQQLFQELLDAGLFTSPGRQQARDAIAASAAGTPFAPVLRFIPIPGAGGDNDATHDIISEGVLSPNDVSLRTGRIMYSSGAANGIDTSRSLRHALEMRDGSLHPASAKQILVCLVAPGRSCFELPRAPELKVLDINKLREQRPRPEHPIIDRSEWQHIWNAAFRQPPCSGFYSFPHGNFHSVRFGSSWKVADSARVLPVLLVTLRPTKVAAQNPYNGPVSRALDARWVRQDDAKQHNKKARKLAPLSTSDNRPVFYPLDQAAHELTNDWLNKGVARPADHLCTDRWREHLPWPMWSVQIPQALCVDRHEAIAPNLVFVCGAFDSSDAVATRGRAIVDLLQPVIAKIRPGKLGLYMFGQHSAQRRLSAKASGAALLSLCDSARRCSAHSQTAAECVRNVIEDLVDDSLKAEAERSAKVVQSSLLSVGRAILACALSDSTVRRILKTDVGEHSVASAKSATMAARVNATFMKLQVGNRVRVASVDMNACESSHSGKQCVRVCPDPCSANSTLPIESRRLRSRAHTTCGISKCFELTCAHRRHHIHSTHVFVSAPFP